MRTLPILLCLLLILAPIQAQQAVQRTPPNFYVPYGVRDLPLTPLEAYSSSGTQPEQPYNIAYAAPSPQMQRRYPPMHRPQLRPYRAGYGRGYGGSFDQQPSTTEVLVGLGLAAFLLTAMAVKAP